MDNEVELISAICAQQDNPFCAMVIGVDFNQDTFYEYINKHQSNPFVKGVRRTVVQPNLTIEAFYPADIIDKIQFLGQHGLSVDICFRPEDLPYAIHLAKNCPNTRFMLDHCGNPLMGNTVLTDDWLHSIKALGQLDNVYCKLSGVIDVADKIRWHINDTTQIMDRCFQAFGEDRICFGSNWPVCLMRTSIHEWLSVVEQHVYQHYGATVKHKLFYLNAGYIYRL